MSWQLDTEIGDRVEHEGWVACVTPDGRLSGSSNLKGVLLERPDAGARARAAWDRGESPTEADMYDRVPWEDVRGFQVACTCGWTGPSWDRSEFTDRTPEYAPMIDAEDSVLVDDGRTVDEAGYAAWMEHMTPLAAQAAIRQAATTAAAAKRALDEAVAAARAAEPPLSWAEIGRAAGISRQAAHVRWGSGGNSAD